MGTTYANLRNQVLGSGQWRGTVPKLPTSQGRSRSPQPSSHPPLRRAPRRERQPFCSHRAHSVPDRAAAIRRYKLGLAPSDIRFYLRFDARCWPIGPEKREVEGDAFVKRPARGLENAPSIWLRMPSGLTAWPLSTAAAARTNQVNRFLNIYERI